MIASVRRASDNAIAPLNGETTFESIVEKVKDLEAKDLIPTPNGAHGAQFCVLEGKKVAVFKTTEPWSLLNVLKGTVGQERLLKQDGRLFTEVIGYKLSEHFGFNLVPQSTMSTVSGLTGVVIQYLEGYDHLRDHKENFIARTTFSYKEKILWQAMSIFNFFIGNLDPHGKNVMVKFDGDVLTDLKMIDLGNSLMQENPEYGYGGRLGAWGKYPIAKEPFHPEFIKYMKTMFTRPALLAFLRKIEEERPDFLNIAMVELFLKRLSILELVKDGTIQTPFDLSEIRTESDYKRLLTKD